jgi:hypothetical protein
MHGYHRWALDPEAPPPTDPPVSYVHHDISGDVDGDRDLNLIHAMTPLKQTQVTTSMYYF